MTTYLELLLWVVSDYIFGTLIITRVTINQKKLITRVTSDRVYISNMEWIDSIDTQLILGYIILIMGILYMIKEINE